VATIVAAIMSLPARLAKRQLVATPTACTGESDKLNK
jgi:hypothetical protein